jgi:polyisoprenoid-binding protein YceI
MSFATRPLLVSAFAVSLLAATGCAKDPAKDVPAATVAEPTAAPAAAPAPEAAPVAAAEPVVAPVAPAAAAAPAGDAKSLTGTIRATGSKVTGSHVLEFKTWKGSLTLTNGDASALEFEIDTASVIGDADKATPGNEKLEGHLKSPDFFDVAQFPKASFKSTSISAGGEGGATHTIAGKLTLRGVEKDVTFPAAVAKTATEVTGKAKFSINRKDFGIVYAGMADNLIRDDVVLEIDVKAAL